MKDNPGRGKTGLARGRENLKVPKYLKLLARKDYRYLYERPYRKPTQVDEEKILRRTREVLLRNSAN